MLKGRLGLDTARVPHADRHGLLWLGRGNLTVKAGTLNFVTAGVGKLAAGDYDIPYQGLTSIVLGPGTTISHDALRLLARHGTGLIAAGEDGVRFYASMPFGADDSSLARRQVTAWADVTGSRVYVTRLMYAWRMGEVLPAGEISVLRGMEGARARQMYKNIAAQYGIAWHGRRYNRQSPHSADLPNQAINHAASAVEGAAMIAVAATSTIPQLGFVHEDSAQSFCLDIADLFRDEVTIPCAFAAVKLMEKRHGQSIESVTRRHVGRAMKEQQVVPKMIDRIKALFSKEALECEDPDRLCQDETGDVA
jgi:CRISPR-associated protein Cas1